MDAVVIYPVATLEEQIDQAAIGTPAALPADATVDACQKCGRAFLPEKLMDGFCSTCTDQETGG